jgi:hypothetical protein
MDVVEVHDTVTGNAVGMGRQFQFGNQVSFRASQRRHHDRLDAVSDRVSRQD